MSRVRKQAKVLSRAQIRAVLDRVRYSRWPERDRVMVLLSVKAGLRAGEISNVTWAMVTDPEGRVGYRIELQDRAAKKLSGRTIPIHPLLRTALNRLRAVDRNAEYVIRSERGAKLHPGSIVNWFRQIYGSLGFDGCSSHSGRRTFITGAARSVGRTGASLRDVQQLAGHRSLDQTMAYIEGDSLAKRRLVAML